MVEGLERLAGAVGLLGRHTTLICVQGGVVVLGVFGAAASGQGTVPTILQIHAGGEGRDAGRRDGSGGGGRGRGGGGGGGGGRWRGLLAGLRNVNLHFSHLENRDRARGREMERVETTAKGWYKINGCTAVTHSCFALPRDSTGKVR